jgi:hypothetical protein
MFEVTLDSNELRRKVKFTDPFIHYPQKEEEILKYYGQGLLRNPSVVKDGDKYLIFNGNHRILVAIAYELSITCTVLENMQDILKSQQNEGEDYRDIDNIVPLSFENIIKNLRESAKKWSTQNPDDYSFKDY